VSSGAFIALKDTPVILPQLTNQLYDLMYALGAFSTTGNVISANGANLSLNKTAGTLFSVGFNRSLTPNDPHVSSIAAQAPVTFRHYTRSIGSAGALTTTLDVSHYDVGGVVTAIGGGNNSATNFRIFVVGQSTVAEQVLVQYGQTVYSSLANAQAGLRSGAYVLNPTFGRAVALVGYISVIRTATNLSDPTQAIFTKAGKFDIP
jgi:hypothetical protein